MNRRKFLARTAAAGTLPAAPSLAFQSETSRLKITGLRLVRMQPRRRPPTYTPTPGSWSTGNVEVASPMSIYPEYKAKRSLFFPDPGNVESFAVEVATNKGIKGYGRGGPGGGPVVEGHLAKLMTGRDPFDLERNWDIMWRGTLHYGGAGVTMNAISGVDLACWDIVGKALGEPVWRLLGGETKQRIPAYCTGNDVEQHIEFGFRRLKLAMPYGPADGRDGMNKNVDLVKQTRSRLGPDGDVMLDCWMAWTERYTLEMAETLAPYRVYWMEECLPPYDYEGFGRLNAAIKSTRIVTGEHIYGRYGFRNLLEHNAAAIWQPDVSWCGGMTELRRIGALAAVYDIPVIPHDGGRLESAHFIQAAVNSPWAELFIPPPGGPPEVYKMFEEDYGISRGPEGVYMRPGNRPGLGWDIEVSS
jgi:L-rhamnonate dehydratase